MQYSDSLSPVNWLTLTNIPAPAVQTTIVMSDIPVAPQRCYRLELP